MHFTCLVAGALFPGKLADALSASLDTPNLKARLARARSVEENTSSARRDGNAHLDWLARELFSQPAPAPTAPYAYAQLAGEIPNHCVWHADPIHVEVARDQLLVQTLIDRPAAEELRQLFEVASELASAAGCTFTSAGDHWFLTAHDDWAIDTSPLAAVIATPVSMPAGRDASIWNRLHNEIQIAWHAHEVNQTRDENAQQTINALWLHGGGRWKPLAPIRYSQVHSNAPEYLGAASAAGARGAPLGFGDSKQAADRALLILDDPLLPARLEDWTAWLQAMAAIDQRLTQYPSAAIDLVLTGSSTRMFQSRSSDRLKPWRRHKLNAALTE